jgi:hypothetical protein
MFWLFFDLNETFFHPFDGLGISAKPILVRSVSSVTGTPGNDPVNVPADALLPSIVTTPFLSSLPNHISIPEDGPVYRAAVEDGAALLCCGVAVTGAAG